MHASSMENMYKCYSRYFDTKYYYTKNNLTVIDVGGSNINGSYKDIFSDEKINFKTTDIHDSKEVDIVLKNPYKLPFHSNSIDILISGQTFEHVEFFWLLFSEMVRVLKNDGLIFLITPSSGTEHKFPVDCYRFYPDSYTALAKYTNCFLIDFWKDQRGPWKDLVGVFGKNSIPKFKKSDIQKNYFNSKYAEEFNPSTVYPKQVDQFEIVKGTTSYLKILKTIHNIKSPQLYLEVGVRKGKSLALSKTYSIAMDPIPDIETQSLPMHIVFKCSSDDFFEWYAEEVLNQKIDLSFIDGMHLFEFVLRDFINVEKYSTKHTVIAIDDILPNHEQQAKRKRRTKAWTGDVWKIYFCLKEYRPDLKMLLIDSFPTGLLLITNLNPLNNTLIKLYNPIVKKYHNIQFRDFSERLLNRVDAIKSNEFILKKFCSNQSNNEI